MKHWSFIFLVLLLSCQSQQDSTLDKSGFEQIKAVIPDITYDIKYATQDNFVGTVVDGYSDQSAYITKEALKALVNVQSELNSAGLGIKVFDAYRPQKAVDHFVRWGKIEMDTLTKAKYYPQINKSEVFALGFVATRSGHSRGSTIDLTIINLESKQELDMGSPFDFFGDISHHDSPLVNEEQTNNRNVLRQVMINHGFKPYANEWWHYTLIDEPFPDTYFNFDNEL